jgi:hypothetical protein
MLSRESCRLVLPVRCGRRAPAAFSGPRGSDDIPNIRHGRTQETAVLLHKQYFNCITLSRTAPLSTLFIASAPLKQQPWAASHPIRPRQLSIWQCASQEVLLLCHFSFRVLPQGALPHRPEIRAAILRHPQIRIPSAQQLSERRRFPGAFSTQRAAILDPQRKAGRASIRAGVQLHLLLHVFVKRPGK